MHTKISSVIHHKHCLLTDSLFDFLLCLFYHMGIKTVTSTLPDCLYQQRQTRLAITLYISILATLLSPINCHGFWWCMYSFCINQNPPALYFFVYSISHANLLYRLFRLILTIYCLHTAYQISSKQIPHKYILNSEKCLKFIKTMGFKHFFYMHYLLYSIDTTF